MLSANEALKRLREGNRRYVSGTRSPSSVDNQARRRELAGGQQPFAVILGCADSRVPPEAVFDQGLGDLFVIRVAGNIAGPTQIGSMEFAVSELGSRLVVVLGHSSCGAVTATVKALEQPDGDVSPGLASIIDELTPAVKGVMHANSGNSREELIAQAVRANVRVSVEQLHNRSWILQQAMQRGDVVLTGAEYSLETGAVDFFEGAPEDA